MVTLTSNSIINIFPSPTDLFQFAAEDFSRRAIETVKQKGIFSVVLSGGNTPKSFFEVLAKNYRTSVPWQQIKFFFGDERYVPDNSVENNFHMADQYLFAEVPVNPHYIYRIPTGFADPKDAAKSYEQTLKKVFDIEDNELPPFDLVYLGLGDNAHTASLMPSNEVVRHAINHPIPSKNNALVASLYISENQPYRITLTPSAINNAKDIIFLVTGANKSRAVWDVLAGKTDPLHYPAQLIHSIHGQTIWYLDQAAAEKIRPS